MIVLIHILFAITSLIQTSFAFVAPSLVKLKTAYVLVFGTLASGSYLVWSAKAPLAQACLTGLVYLGIIFCGIIAARYKLVRIHTDR